MSRYDLAVEDAATLIDRVADPIFVLDSADRFVYMNPKAESYLQRSFETLKGKVVWEEYPPMMQTPLYSGTQRIKEQKEAEDVEYFSPVTKRWIKACFSPYRDGVMIHLQDFTEEYNAKQALRKSTQHLRNVLDSLFVFVGVMTPEGTLIEANQAALQSANLVPEEVLGKKFEKTYWWSYSHEVQQRLRGAIEMAAQGHAQRYDERVRLGEHRFIIIDFMISPMFDEQGRVVYLVPSGMDITERKHVERDLSESEAKFRTLAESLPQIVWTAKPDGSVDYYNQRWEEYSGVERGQARDWGWQPALHPDDEGQTVLAWKRAVTTGGLYEVSHRVRSADGEYRWFLSRGIPLRDEGGEIVKWFGTATDIDEQKRLLERKEEFISMASHELKTPMTSLKAYTQLFRRMFQKNGYAKFLPQLEKMEIQVEKLTKLITDMLDVSKIQQDQLVFRDEEFDFDELIQEVVEEVQATSETHTIELTGSANVLFWGDRARIEQVVANLLANAIKYSPRAERVEVMLAKEDNGDIHVAVRDYGIGIPRIHQNKVFDRFYRVNSAEKSVLFPGLGIGLYIARNIVHHYGGKMWMESEEGEGSTFHFTLPVVSLGGGVTRENYIGR